MTLRAYDQRSCGCYVSIVLPTIDVETFSEAGYIYDSETERFKTLVPNKPGIKGVGAVVYAEHPTTEVLSVAPNMCDGNGTRLWVPGMDPPQYLFDYILNGGLIEAHNSEFEYFIWLEKLHKTLGWPPLPLEQLRCSQAKAYADARPGGLDKLTEVLDTHIKKNKDGKRLIRKFSIPRSPTKKDKRLRILPKDDPLDAYHLYSYNVNDTESQMEVSQQCPDLSPFELEVWLTSQRINARGVQIDVNALNDCLSIYEQANTKYVNELTRLTCGQIDSVNKTEKIRKYLSDFDIDIPNVQAETVETTLKRKDLPFNVRRVLLIRQWLSMASVKKLNAINRLRCGDDRIRGLFTYYKAHTGRWAGSGAQPQNLASSGPPIECCGLCGKHQKQGLSECLWCSSLELKEVKWCLGAAEDVLILCRSRSLELVEQYFGEALRSLSGSLRALFIAKPGYDLICSDYSAIEAVVIAELAGEEWRKEVFRTHRKIYEMSASKITGVPFEDFLEYRKVNNSHHPLRQKIGKYAELSSVYGGWLDAWLSFGAGKYLTNDEIIEGVKKWREASPAIVEFWGGQWRKDPNRWSFTQEYYGLEGAAICAILNPGQAYSYRSITYGMKGDALYCKLPSGRLLTYHEPRLTDGIDNYSKKPIYQLSYMGWNSDSKKGPVGWLRLYTYGGSQANDVTQGTARDILAAALIRVEKAGYPVVLHVHDEPVSEIPEGWGSIEEYERLISIKPYWCKDWPIIAADGWRGKRYRKD